jgi:hypothetical protein
MRAFPELRAKFDNAASLSKSIGDAAANRRAQIDEYQTGALGKITGLSDPSEVTRAVGGILSSPTGVTQMRQLAQAASKDPQAMIGLRKSVAEFMRGRLVSNADASGNGTIRSNAYQNFVKQNAPALRTVFSEPEVNSMQAIADDLQRSARSKQMLLVPGTPSEGQPSVLRKIIAETAGAAVGGAVSHTPLVGPAIGWLGVKVVNALRDAGISRTDELVREAMLHPEVAKALLAKVPKHPGPTAGNHLAAALARSSIIGTGPSRAVMLPDQSQASQ